MCSSPYVCDACRPLQTNWYAPCPHAFEFRAMRPIRVHFEDGNTLETCINGTPPDILNFYIGQPFQFGDTEECPRDKLVKAVRVEFLD